MSQVDLSIIGEKTDPVIYDYTWKDVALYALGVGASTDQLPFIYERASGGLQVLPSFCLVPAMRGYPPLGANVDWARFLHGEQTIRLHRPMAPEGRIVVIGEVTDIFDKGKAATYHIRVSGQDEDGAPVFDTYWVSFYLGAGGFGGDPGPKAETSTPPEGVSPDYSVTCRVAENQAALYRLNGDLNPLHIDPQFAKRGGFDRPILHGLCTYGFAVRSIVTHALDGDVERLRSFKARFSSPVYMGDNLTTQCWRQGNRLIVQSRTEWGVVLSNAVAEIR
jgi:acyl dehydratase